MRKVKYNANWRKTGVEPDYRFSLANERTYLAWIRTALALLAGSIALDQMATQLAHPQLKLIISMVLALFSIAIAILGYLRWSKHEKAMRQELPFPYTSLLKVTSVFIGLITLLVIVFLLV
ncbi:MULTISPECIES: YidH family protein [unclassified Vibrio]|uniref:YidH family protein n=1 Tax=unclassified Vibrio TaxID=2614977 RepID=UPI003550B708